MSSLRFDHAALSREQPHHLAYRSCGAWPIRTALNATLWGETHVGHQLSSLFKLRLAGSSAAFCPSDLVIRTRPSLAVDVASVWAAVEQVLLKERCLVVVPREASWSGVNDQFAVMTVRGWRSYASAYDNFEGLYRDCEPSRL